MTTDQAQRLTPKQEQFVAQYVLTGNGTQAAINAGYSPNTAPVIASENLRKPNVQTAIQQRKAELAQSRFEVTPEWVIQKLAERAASKTSPSASVSALRTLADILGMTAGNARELPDALNAMLEAVARGLAAGSKQAGLPAGRTLEILPSSSPGDSEQDGPG